MSVRTKSFFDREPRKVDRHFVRCFRHSYKLIQVL